MLANKLMSSLSGGTEEKLYVDDVFSSYLYTGNGATQTINNGIDLAGKGGLVWGKSRSSGVYSHALISNATGLTVGSSNLSNAFSAAGPISAFNSNGFTLGTASGINASGESEITWTFRRSPKFFDVVTYTGNGASSRAIAHSLGQEVGMVMTKATSTTGDWNTYHRSATGDLVLNTTAAQTGSKALVNSATTSTFTVSGAANTNAVTYVAYLFSHDDSADGIIQCGSFTTDASGNATVNLGWEPQYVLVKRTSSTGNWLIQDSMRGFIASDTVGARLYADASYAEDSNASVRPTATGFSTAPAGTSASVTHIYLAIRRPNKPPTTGTEVYNAIARTGTGAAATVTGVGFAPDTLMSSIRVDGSGFDWFGTVLCSRLTGAPQVLGTWTSGQENFQSASVTGFTHSGVTFGADTSGSYAGRVNATSASSYINHFFRRAPGFMDVVCYTGTGDQLVKVNHNLTVRPELIIIKTRSAVGDWHVTVRVGPNLWKTWGTLPLSLNNTSGGTADTYTWDTNVNTSTYFSPYTTTNGNLDMSVLGTTYVAYLFATTPGVSKVGRYIGNGTTQTINCGFTTGARFILIKRTDATGDWYVWDTTRGIISANDPHLSLNTAAAEVTTDDSVDPASSGFIVNQVAATNINVSGGQYIFLAIA